ncbi:MAG: hypothetical protein HGB01_01300 [Chlorobiaceae bacterium]|nr:hypothetical protein [Chlorobiaceae bacterium]NTV24828.1 hypothetical protein [Chlorobiaceae bacterium]
MRPLTAFLAFSVLLVAVLLAFPELTLNPGPLLGGHEKLKHNCLACHVPFGGAAASKCVECHRPDSIDSRSVSGALLPGASKKVSFHRGLSPSSCLECHTDHKGPDAKKSLRSFSHDLLPASIRNGCNACHSESRPKDSLHRQFGSSCAQCHDTRNWRSALFDHRMLQGGTSVNCLACHAKEKPDDSIHRQINMNCAGCHSTMRWKPATFDHRSAAASGKQCVSCHVGDRPKDTLHSDLQASCGSCHGTGRWKPATFDHRSAAASGKQCVSCHVGDRPKDTLHSDLQTGCGSCHGTGRWKPATFDHRSAAASGKQCVSCHGKERPKDTLHSDLQASCGSCHGTERWKPARFDHDRYFRLDGDHRTGCRTCHTEPSNFRSYTCYGCHEHSRSGIAAEHLKEGISNFQNCIRCHRSADEHGREGGRSEREHDDD